MSSHDTHKLDANLMLANYGKKTHNTVVSQQPNVVVLLGEQF